MISGLKAALGAPYSELHHYWIGKEPLRIHDCFSALVAVSPFFLCTLIGEARQDDVHEQQTAALRHASFFTRAQVHHSALQLGSYKESLSTNSTGKLFPPFNKLRFVPFFVTGFYVLDERCQCVTRGAPSHIQTRRALNVFFMYPTASR